MKAFRLIAMLFLCVIAYGQNGSISGTVFDPSGASVPGAEITVTDVASGYSRTATANAQGQYTVPSLRPSTYTVNATNPGFKRYSRTGVIVGADQRVTANIELAIGATEEAVTVSAETAQVDIQTSTLTQVIDSRRMADMPLNG